MFQEKNKSINSLKINKIPKVFSSNKQQVTQVWTCCFKIILKHEFLSYKINWKKISKMQMPSARQHAQKELGCSNYLPHQSRTSQASSFKKIQQVHQLLLFFFVTFYSKVTWNLKGCSIVVLNIFPWFYFHHGSWWLKTAYSILSGYLSKWKLNFTYTI